MQRCKYIQNKHTPRRRMRMAVLILTFVMGALLALPQTALAVSLKESGKIEHDQIRLGDIFDGLEQGEDKILGAAPRPGQDMTLNARTLLRIAIAMDLPWRPATRADQIVLRRAATIIDKSMIEEALKKKIIEQGIPGRFEINLSGDNTQIVLPQDMEAGLDITSLDMQAGRGSFKATIAAPSKDNPVKQMDVTGTLQRMVEIPVLQGTLQSGDIISERDLAFVEMRSENIVQDIALRAEDVIGMSPRRMIHAGQPIKTNEIQPPKLVDRGDSVLMIFTLNGLTLTAQGKALEPGAKGDTIRVTNGTSNKTVEARVTNTGEVTVQNF
ncbi:MAG: flagellar basal body P-ring formation protein FlgA [Alphaproteobacteria bacterium]|nr:flagellar basal body P-ring formation protein FlgA [Alphaproteobacteria bacterium]